MNNAKYKGTKL